MPKAGSELSEQQASTEMTFRLNHARQTVEFVQRQAASFGQLNKAKLGIWEALQHLDSLDEQRSIVATAAEEPHMSLFDHAIQTAELCRLAHPQQDWLHLVGLIHGLGKLMALPSFGAQPSWAVFAESFPVGCRFSSSIPCSQFFSVNPDRRRRLYSSTTGMYESGCGLSAVYMSWTACEYLYLMLVKKKTALPPVARFVLRHYNFLALMRPGNAYTELLSSADFAMMPWLRKFQALQQAPQQHIEGRLEGHDLRQYYNGLVAKFIPGGMLQF
nr:myo-inositol oxygenase [Trebouxia lynnae]